MTTTDPTPTATVEGSALERYAPSVLSFFVLVLTGGAAALQAGIDGVAIAQFLVLVLTTGTTWLVPLVGGKWQGALKTGLEVLGVAITLALPFIATGSITWSDALLVGVGILKAVGAELGVQIRTNATEEATATIAKTEALAQAMSAVPPIVIQAVDPTTVQYVGEPELLIDDTDGPAHRAEPSS